MRSHGVKAILIGRILEILYARANVKCPKRTMTVDEIYDRLKNEEFSPRVASYIKTAGGITKPQIRWLLTLMSKTARMPFRFIEIPLVSCKRGRNGGEWKINRTTTHGDVRPLNIFGEKRVMK